MSERKNFEFFTLGEEESVKHAPNKTPSVLDSSFFFSLRESRGVAALNGPRHIAPVGSACTHVLAGIQMDIKAHDRTRANGQAIGRTGRRQWGITRGITSASYGPVVICNLDFIIARWPCNLRSRVSARSLRIDYFLHPIASPPIIPLNVRPDDTIKSSNSI